MAKRNKHKIIPEEGLLVAIPLSNRTYGLSNIAYCTELSKNNFSVTWAFYDLNVKSIDEFRDKKLSDEYLSKPVIVCSMDSEEFEDGEWPIIGTYKEGYSNVSIIDNIKGQMKWYKGEEKPGVMLLEMYLGILPWNLMHDPNYLDKILLPGYSRPSNIRLK